MMPTAPWMVELVGPRQALHRLPREGPFDLLSARLRQFHAPRQLLCRLPPTTTTSRSPALTARHGRCGCWGGPSRRPRRRTYSIRVQEASVDAVTDADVLYLRKLVHHYDQKATSRLDELDRRETTTAAQGNGAEASRYDGSEDGVAVAAGVERLPDPFRRALEAIQQRDSRRLLACMQQITAMPDQALFHCVALLPRTTFSEFLRSLDPLEIARQDDPSYQAHIPFGMWKILNMTALVDDYGVRRLYTRLLQRLLRLVQVFQNNPDNPGILNANDYTPLLRATAAAADPEGATIIWRQMGSGSDIRFWRNGEAYNEFVRARFLVDPISAGWDKMRYLVGPRTVHRQGIRLLPRHVTKLDRLRFNTRRSRFGLNKSANHTEDLMRILRNRKPPTRAFFFIVMNGFEVTEKFLCSMIIAFARSASLRFIGHYILEDYFGISIIKDRRTGEIRVGSKSKPGGNSKDWARPPRPTFHPSELLLETVVEAYCTNGQLSMALHLIDYISNQFQIPIRPKLWFELLEWTRVLSSPPVSTSWKMAERKDRVPSPMAVEMIWNVMTSPPHNVQPGFDQYVNMAKNLILRGLYDTATEHMANAAQIYHAEAAAHEDAVFEYTRALRDGIDGIALSIIYRAYQKTRFRKQYMWFKLQTACKHLLSNLRSTILYDDRTARRIPNFIRDFREFCPNPANYRTATGYVQLRDPAHMLLRNVTVPDSVPPFPPPYMLQIPMRDSRDPPAAAKAKAPWKLRLKYYQPTTILSPRSLAEQKSSKLNPLPLLLGDLGTFRTPPLDVGQKARRRRLDRVTVRTTRVGPPPQTP